ncbi:MAG: HlyD family efflux transporter periplasmic adaptor subunit [Patescibacteria group bacterium]
MKKVLNGVKSYIISHKILSIIALITLLGAGYWGYIRLSGDNDGIRYITAKAERGDIAISVSGSGQVSSFNQVDVRAKASGNALYIAMQDGEKIGAGGLIAQLDDKDAKKTVRDAEINLESAKISLEKLKIEKSRENMDADLAKSYNDGFNTVSNVFLDLPEIMTGLNDMFFESDLSTGQWNVDWYEGQVKNTDSGRTKTYKQNFVDSYHTALKSYEANFDNYKNSARASDNTTIEALIAETYDSTTLISDTIKNANNFIDFVNDSIQKNNFSPPSIISEHKATLSEYTSETNTHLVNLLSNTTSIKNYKDAFQNAGLDIKSSELSLKQKENASQDAKDKLADYFIRAPFEGAIAKINIKKSDSVSAGAVVATLITKKQIAEISLNEVDVAKIKIGQKAEFAFDAVPDLKISGIVADIDTIGAVSQGVVTYIVKISFDAQDIRVKSGMSVSAEIITDEKRDVLVIPNSSVKSLPANSGVGQTGKNYVEIFGGSSAVPSRVFVEVGLSNDSQSEIVSGIKEGDEIVVRTILPSASAPATSVPSIFGAGGSRTSGGTVRFQTR